MPVIPEQCHPLHHLNALKDLLAEAQAIAQTRQAGQLLSYAGLFTLVEPLVVLNALRQSGEDSFYLEQPVAGWAIAAFHPIFQRQSEGKQRFDDIRQYVQAQAGNVICRGDRHLPMAGPHFFCSFRFFDQVDPVGLSAPIAAGLCGSYPFPIASVFLPRWQVVRTHPERHAGLVQPPQNSLVLNVWVGPEDNVDLLATEIWQQWQVIQALPADTGETVPPSPNFGLSACITQQDLGDTQQFQRAIDQVLREIAQQHLHKVVLAHAMKVISSQTFDITACLQHLRQAYPDCYIFAIGKGQHHFIGASPERLMTVRQGKLTTDALAGSVRRGQTPEEDLSLATALLENPKERHEHQLVVDFICRCLHQLGLSSIHTGALTLLQLSNIQHLQTQICAAVPANIHPLNILAALHPTPAVAGVPREAACDLIQRWESFARGLYAAPLGWLNLEGDAEFIVGIRSALIENNWACLYAGAGIVKGSDPDRELAEVKLKLQALLAALT